MRIPPIGRMVDIGGRRLHANVMGMGSPPVVLEAGIAASSLSWAMVARAVAEFATVISYDRAGFGWSDMAPHRSTALDAARDLASMLERLEIAGPSVLVGHSFGGLLVRVFEQQYPELVAGLVLVDPVIRADWGKPDERLKRMLAHGVVLSRRGAVLARAGVVRLALRLLLSGSRRIPKMLARVSAGPGAGITEQLVGEIRKMPPELWPAIVSHWSEARCFRAMANSLENLPASIGQLDENRSLDSLPIAVLTAANTGVVGIEEHAHDAGLSSRGEHLVIPNTGHWIQLDAPDAVIDAIRWVSLRV